MNREDALSIIKSFLLELLPDLSEEAWNEFAKRVIIHKYKKGEVVYKPGVVCNYVSYICSGLLRSYFLIDGKEVITAFADTNSYFSDYESFLTQQPVRMYTDALEDTVVVDIDYNNLQELYSTYHDCEKIGRLIAENLFIELSNRNYDFQFDGPEKRYEKFLEQCESIVQRIPQYMIASYIGVTPEALSRIRARRNNGNGNVLVDQDQ